MAKSLYSALFDWIVLRINHALLNKKDMEEAVSVSGQALSWARINPDLGTAVEARNPWDLCKHQSCQRTLVLYSRQQFSACGSCIRSPAYQILIQFLTVAKLQL